MPMDACFVAFQHLHEAIVLVVFLLNVFGLLEKNVYLGILSEKERVTRYKGISGTLLIAV